MPESTTATWRPVLGHEGRYEVSDDGRVRGRRGELSIQSDRYGRPWVALWANNKMTPGRIHRLMAFAFLPPPSPEQTDVCHNDGNVLNNQIGNLRWDTRAGNMRDIVRHQTGRNQNTGRTHCRAGHDLTENAYVMPSGARDCRKCRQARHRAYRARKKESK